MAPPPTTVIIIGTGWAGLAAAKTYLQINPTTTLTLLTNESTVGGVWSRERIYPGLIANSPNGLYEFSDLSMVDAHHPPYELIPAHRVSAYLHAYAEKFDLLRRIRFSVNVTAAVRRTEPAPGWTLTLASSETVECEKLIVATGLYHKPKWPAIPAAPSFTGTVIHSKTLGSSYAEILAAGAREIVVVGGCKSAVEAASLFLDADEGVKVHWVVRPSAQGVPMVVVDAAAKPNFVAVAQTRLFSVWGPTVFNVKGFWYWFLHSRTSWVGRVVFDAFWGFMSRTVKKAARYGRSENGRRIEPEGESMFWDSSYISLLYNDSPFLAWLHETDRIQVHRETPIRLADGHMILESSEKIKADAVVYCTGWEPSIDFFSSPAEAANLGIPVPRQKQKDANARSENENEAHWAELMTAATAHVQRTLPYLANDARPPVEQPAYTPFRMYRQVLSPRLLAEGDRSIVFAGFTATGQTVQCDELIALWGVAWLEGLMSLPPLYQEEELEWEVAMVNACMQRRYGARGAKDPEIILEAQWFFDVLMRDLGLSVKRKQGRGWFGGLKEWVMPYTAADYRGVVDEYLASCGRRKSTDLRGSFDG